MANKQYAVSNQINVLNNSGRHRLSSGLKSPVKMKPYQYFGLHPDKQEIRLLTLFPGHIDDELRISLVTANLRKPVKKVESKRMSPGELEGTLPSGWRVWKTFEGRYLFEERKKEQSSWTHPDTSFDQALYESPGERELQFELRYEALSYTWGSSAKSETVYVGPNGAAGKFDGTMQIRQNLACALKHLRYVDQPRTLWIDAVCINQQDDVEKNTQVKLMGRIYSLASRVIAWLGPEEHDSKHALLVLQHLGKQIEYSQGWIFRSPDATEPDWWNRVFHLPYEERTWSAITSLISRSWFGRLWVLQEIQLANQHTIVMCGKDVISWSHLRRAILRLKAQPGLPLDIFKSIRRASTVAQNLSDLTFPRLVTKVLNHHCCNPRDKLYGILSLAPASLADKIQPDYSLSVSHVYKDAFLVHLRLVQRLDLFQFCRLAETRNFQPSWVPNWGVIKRTFSWASFAQAASHSVAKVRYIQPHTLEVTGVQCATIRTAGKVASGGTDQISRTIRDWEFENLDKSDYIREPMLNAFVRLLVYGRVRDKFPECQLTTLRELVDKYRQHVSSPLPKKGESWLDHVQIESLKGSSFVTTHEGHIGLVDGLPKPSAFFADRITLNAALISVDDRVCVFLGCCRPMLLRPTQSGQFLVVGRIWIAGLMGAEALLGQVQEPWKVQYGMHGARMIPQYLNTVTKEIVIQDPRIGPLPPQWEPMFNIDTADDYPNARFRNNLTGEVDSDPRLCPEALEKRGVKLQTFQLI